ncbi:DEAD/DEAH box helicase [Actinomyces polynesiensis]|uniref:DEAD/DEAH box helicase n=1 Tax=Actinomyces polynesiensis TaxID=1325934 RepID=UPI000693E189|nr:DEAD/DEAH box helicase [Actinomyces polynesiensis]
MTSTILAAQARSDASAATTSSPTFASLGVPAELVTVLEGQGKATAFPIQTDTLPDTLSGRDVLGRGRTGSGKTLAFAIPLVARLAEAGRTNTPRRPRALVLAPTRELASQIAEVIEPLGRAYGLRVTTIFGGVKQTRQEMALSRGAAVVVACPGRLEDLMGQGLVSLSDIAVTVIDEADLMADMGFLPAVTRILRATPEVGQRMLFSATLDNGVDRLVRQFLHDPVLHSVDPAESPVEQMTHHVFEVADADRKKDLIEALASGTGRRILFFRTKHRAKRTARQLSAAGIPAVDLQGNLSQNARDRNLAAFDSGEVRVLAATDVAARGVDVADVELVIHADPPREHKEYLHRSGRTARAGHSGDVVTICLPEERRDLAQVLRKAKIHVTPERVDAHSPEVAELVGERAARVAPRPAAQPEGSAGSSTGSRRHPAGGHTSGGSTGGRSRGRRGGQGGQGGAASGRGPAQSQGSRSGSSRSTSSRSSSATRSPATGADEGGRGSRRSDQHQHGGASATRGSGSGSAKGSSGRSRGRKSRNDQVASAVPKRHRAVVWSTETPRSHH